MQQLTNNVSWGIFSYLQIRPHVGRGFTKSSDRGVLRNGAPRLSAGMDCPHSPHSEIKWLPKEISRSSPAGSTRTDQGNFQLGMADKAKALSIWMQKTRLNQRRPLSHKTFHTKAKCLTCKRVWFINWQHPQSCFCSPPYVNNSSPPSKLTGLCR